MKRTTAMETIIVVLDVLRNKCYKVFVKKKNILLIKLRFNQVFCGIRL